MALALAPPLTMAASSAGNMAVAASGQGGILVRVDPAEVEALLASTNAYRMEMRGRPVRAWLRVDAGDVESEDELVQSVERGVRYARSLPPKAHRGRP